MNTIIFIIKFEYTKYLINELQKKLRLIIITKQK